MRMQKWNERAKNIKKLNEVWLKKGQARLDEQTRPQGSLGRLEEVISKLAAIQKRERLDISKKRIFVFACDHGVEKEGVSLYPRAVTRAMVLNFLNGGATINSLARQTNAEVKVIDIGVDGTFEDHPDLIKAKIRNGTGNIKIEPAMSQDELNGALQVGWDMVERAVNDGIDIIGLGEMGIGNTTPSAAVIAALLDCPASKVTGRGTGIDEERLKLKVNVIDEALKYHQGALNSPFDILQRLGGFEIAAMTGVILACAQKSIPVVVDGIVVAASTLVAYRLNNAVCDYVFLAHESQERGHRTVIEELNQIPLLALSMRLGEASGAALAFNILEAGVNIYNEVATFQEAEVANKKETVKSAG